MEHIVIDSKELCNRIKNYLGCRDINDASGGRTIPVYRNIDCMARDLTREICKTKDEYYDYDDFRSRA